MWGWYMQACPSTKPRWPFDEGTAACIWIQGLLATAMIQAGYEYHTEQSCRALQDPAASDRIVLGIISDAMLSYCLPP